jgi:hypothetical protein
MKLAAAFAVASTPVASAAMAAGDKPVELTPTQLAAVQSKTYSVPANTAFAASIATLQTLGYVDINASKDAGTISAQTEAKGKIFYNILWGFGKKKLTQKASLLVEENGTNRAMVRLNLHVTETKARGIFGTSFSDGKLVKVANPYSAFFAALDGEVARRIPVAPALAPTTTETAPAATTASAPAANGLTPNPADMPSALTPTPNQ